jgi:hypothetical protein
MPKITLKQVQQTLSDLRTKMSAYVQDVRYPQYTVHSKSTSMQADAEGRKARAMVSIEELIITARTAEILGKNTILRVTDGGKALEILFVNKQANVDVPSELYGG